MAPANCHLILYIDYSRDCKEPEAAFKLFLWKMNCRNIMMKSNNYGRQHQRCPFKFYLDEGYPYSLFLNFEKGKIKPYTS
ncbi:hypothetical protein PBAL39_14899 [Pedobacter sp. BAL39]|nr:hypothetical protein PBAL39_14899 [Pedobacter sp. BAL39]